MDFLPSQHLGSIFRTERFESVASSFRRIRKEQAATCTRRRQQQSSFNFRPLKNFMASFSPDIDLKMNFNPLCVSGISSSGSKELITPPLIEFQLFTILPPELRIKVWRMAIPNLSIMIVGLGLSNFEIRFQTQEKLAGILGICKESRRITKSERPYRLRTCQPVYQIRFHPDTVIYVPNLVGLVSYMETWIGSPLGYGNAF